jgi:hypothetical protein
MISDPRFNELIGGIIAETTDEASILADLHNGRVIESPAIISFCHILIEEIPTAHAELVSRFPDADMEETILGIVQLAWDYGFRAGRIFQARGHEVPGEDNDDE